MVTRRSFLVTASAALICAPAVVQATSLMPVRGIVFPIDRHCFGFVERLYVHCNLPTIIKLQNAGLSAHETAAEMNARKMVAINGDAWDAERVIGLIKRDELIRRTDLILRAERIRHR